MTTTTKRYDENGQRICEEDGCGRPHRARGLCARCWTRWRRHGDTKALVYGQCGDNPKPCHVCGTPIPPRERRSAPKVCSQRCQNRDYYQRHYSVRSLYERMTAGM